MISRRSIGGVLAGLTVFGAVFAMAANLGGITSGKVGADNVAVASCDIDGVTTKYASSWDATDKQYEVTSVTVSGINDACDTQTLSVSLTDLNDVQIGSASASIPADALSQSVTVALSPAASAKATVGVHVAIA